MPMSVILNVGLPFVSFVYTEKFAAIALLVIIGIIVRFSIIMDDSAIVSFVCNDTVRVSPALTYEGFMLLDVIFNSDIAYVVIRSAS